MNLKWIAYYEDGKCLHEGEVKYYDLPREGLKCFRLIDGIEPKLSVCLDDGQTLFYRRRNFRLFGTDIGHIYLVGWRKRLYHREDGLLNTEVLQEIYRIDETGRIAEFPNFESFGLPEIDWNEAERV